MIIQKLEKQGLIQPPKWLADNTAYLTIMGSNAYAVASDNSDMDIYGFCLPPRDIVFPHLAGEIPGFGRQQQRFEQWQQHHIQTSDGKEYDFSVYSIVKYVNLCMENNPNLIDSLFVPRRCIIHSTPLSEHLRENRKLFLHKGAWHKFKGYSYSQMTKMRNKSHAENPKRAADIARIGYDSKFAYHIIRLISEVEQILVEGDLDLERNREQLKSVRRGEWTLQQIEQWFQDKERDLESVYLSSTLPYAPDEAKIKQLLLDCLEMHYGDISTAINREVNVDALLRDMQTVINRYGS